MFKEAMNIIYKKEEEVSCPNEKIQNKILEHLQQLNGNINKQEYGYDDRTEHCHKWKYKHHKH